MFFATWQGVVRPIGQKCSKWLFLGLFLVLNKVFSTLILNCMGFINKPPNRWSFWRKNFWGSFINYNQRFPILIWRPSPSRAAFQWKMYWLPWKTTASHGLGPLGKAPSMTQAAHWPTSHSEAVWWASFLSSFFLLVFSFFFLFNHIKFYSLL